MRNALYFFASLFLCFTLVPSLFPVAADPEAQYTFEGTLRRMFNQSTCTSKVDADECYKLHFPDGTFYWLKRQTVLPISEFDTNWWKKVKVTGPWRTATSGNTYLLVRAISTSIFDDPVLYGIGGGYYSSGYSSMHTALGVEVMDPGIFWQPAQPSQANKLYTNYASPIWDSLDADMAYCQASGKKCGIYIGGVPAWAVSQAKAKTGLICDNNEDGVEDASSTYSFPLNPSAHQEFANFVAAVGERFDGDGDIDGDGDLDSYKTNLATIRAEFIDILNEPDFGSAFTTYSPQAPSSLVGDGKATCSDPKYWTTSTFQDTYKNSSGTPVSIHDLNDNSVPDNKDYADLFWAIYTTVNPNLDANGLRIINLPINFGRLASYYQDNQSGSPNNASKNFLTSILSYGYGSANERPYSFMDLHYYDSDELSFYDPVHNVKGIRGKIHSVKSLMSANGGVKPIRFTEMGRPVTENADEEKLQAQSVFKIAAQAYSTGIVKSLQWYKLEGVVSSNPASQDWQFALHLSSPRERPAYKAYQVFQQAFSKVVSDWRFYQLNAANLCAERYTFQNEIDYPGVRKEVVWASNRKTTGTCSNSFRPQYSAAQIKVTTTNGVQTVINDNQTGDLDPLPGIIETSVSSDPVIVEY